MQTKTKSILVLIGVLIIGIIIGAVGSSLIRKNVWEERVSRFRTPEGFTQRIIERIDPDPDKREAVEQILLEQHEKLRRKFEHTRVHMEAHVDSVLQRLQPLLKDEQFERAKRFLKRKPPHLGRERGKFRRPVPPPTAD